MCVKGLDARVIPVTGNQVRGTIHCMCSTNATSTCKNQLPDFIMQCLYVVSFYYSDDLISHTARVMQRHTHLHL